MFGMAEFRQWQNDADGDWKRMVGGEKGDIVHGRCSSQFRHICFSKFVN